MSLRVGLPAEAAVVDDQHRRQELPNNNKQSSLPHLPP
ncbi:unnamed protein product [Chondrus crispus]|uniref:Uncharacterized protein n=1 Tax=Chondrus crispus TaxID=2769 RepID=R7QL90_CHOCR|nr:unnamed protein product [Chondrus crispus]CDF38854.1 unnamed protein product [Chondrus crispus]|eukprot:XP_005718759.1 unnamed protein product [Chondrus crispus]